jgi:threonine dehydrogenase-like Zn-dependent dehydrogenase
VEHQQLKEKLKKYKSYFPPALQRFGVKLWKTIEIPLAALLEGRSIVKANRIFWPAAEVADFDRKRILGPSTNDSLVDVAFTVMSPGTERAQFLGLPDSYKHITGVEYYPGYSGSGKVIAVGKKVSRFNVGDRVAGRIAHGSPAAAQEQFLFRIPDGVSLEKAAFIELGIIVLQGIRKARIIPGESVLILGQGLIGQLANRLSRLAGAVPILAVAKSRAKAKESIGKGGADRFLTVKELNEEGVSEGYDVVIESTGDANILRFACGLARTGGRVVGLGTPRGLGRIHLGQDGCRPGIIILGAHITGMPQSDQTTGLWTYRSEGQLFLDLLAKHKLALDDLITQRIDPSRANRIYESLRIGEPRIVGIVFDWRNYESIQYRAQTEKD